MPTMDLEKEVRELKRRLDLTETRVAQLERRFEFISGQLRDIQLFTHARFDDVDRHLEQHDRRFDQLEAKVDAIPRAVADLIAGRS